MVDDPNLDVDFGPAKDVPVARPPSRFRFTLRLWMIVVVVVGGLLALVTLPLRRQAIDRALHATFEDQRSLTERVLDGPVAKLWPSGSLRGHRTNSSHGTDGWRLHREMWSDASFQGPPYLVDLEFVSDAAHGGPSVIWVFDRGAQFNGQALRLLAAEYAKHGWSPRIVSNPGADPSPQPAADVGDSAQ